MNKKEEEVLKRGESWQESLKSASILLRKAGFNISDIKFHFKRDLEDSNSQKLEIKLIEDLKDYYNNKEMMRMFEIEKMRPSRDEVFIEMSKVLARRSTCIRAQVGAMIVLDGRPISVGYNGPPSGIDCIKCKGASCDVSIHAEMNAIAFAAKAGVSIKGSILYCTMSPCNDCAKIIANSGIVEVVYLEQYRKVNGLELLQSCGVKTRICSPELLRVNREFKMHGTKTGRIDCSKENYANEGKSDLGEGKKENKFFDELQLEKILADSKKPCNCIKNHKQVENFHKPVVNFSYDRILDTHKCIYCGRIYDLV